MANADWIRENGKSAQGKNEYVNYLRNGQKLSPLKAIKANCYQCMNSYADGKIDCEIPDCPLYPHMPYRKDKTKARRAMTEKQQQAFEKLVSIRSGIRRTASGKT
jgi:hypothetical protein